MPTQLIVTSNDSIGIRDDLATENRVFVTAGVTVSSVNDDAIRFLLGASTVQVSGTVVSLLGNAIEAGTSLDVAGLGSAITVTAGGVVASQGNDAIRLGGQICNLINAGTIMAGGTTHMPGGSAAVFTNDAAYVLNTGEIFGSSDVLRFSSDALGTGLVNRLFNYGLIYATGPTDLIRAIDSYSGALDLLNRGEIRGYITLSDSDDVVDNGGGTITGHISFRGGNDLLIGGDSSETASGGAGEDVLDFGGGNDVFVAYSAWEPSDDNDELDGGDGVDTYDASGLASTVTIRLHEQRAVGNAIGRDLVMNFESAIGGSGNDSLVGDAGRNVLRGNGGRDTINGLEGNDRILGGAGADVINGNAGRDVMTGGTNFDLFDFNAVTDSGVGDSVRDIITDFVQGFDLIDLNTIDADTVAGGNQKFLLIGTAAFTSVAGQLRYSNSDATQYTTIEGDVNGDGRADFQIGLFGSIVLTADDFML